MHTSSRSLAPSHLLMDDCMLSIYHITSRKRWSYQ